MIAQKKEKYEPHSTIDKSKSKKREKIKIRFCPNCGNTEVKYVFRLRNIFGVVPRMECPKCGCHNAIFPIIEIDKEKIKDVEKLISKIRKGEKKYDWRWDRYAREH